MLSCGILCNLTFSHFDTIPECDRQTHDDGIYNARIALRGTNWRHSALPAARGN